MPRNWREWFVPPDQDPPEHEQIEQAAQESGARHRQPNKLVLKKKTAPKCAGCKRWMGYNDGMYVIISGDWRVHIKCFSKILDRHFDNGEVIDLTTGQIIKLEQHAAANRETDDS